MYAENAALEKSQRKVSKVVAYRMRLTMSRAGTMPVGLWYWRRVKG